MTRDEERIITKIIGKNLKNIRKNRRMSQTDLGKSAGVSFQQIQKYEKGKDRISGAKFYMFSKMLTVSIEAFFNGID